MGRAAVADALNFAWDRFAGMLVARVRTWQHLPQGAPKGHCLTARRKSLRGKELRQVTKTERQTNGPVLPYWRPRKRSECKEGHRPCPYVGCRHHLYLEISPKGSISLPPGEDTDVLWGMGDTCSLDVADRGPQDLPKIAEMIALTKAMAGQIEEMALAKIMPKLLVIYDEP